ncbi:hypothetical protein [Pseudomonas sp. Gutcm_11s]|nr:hypothetical protein [Pseudomonas sp. Gutcm_11s]MDD0841233.1 hypothetical protein [Pseudomonas sp. Gutcm_11s]
MSYSKQDTGLLLVDPYNDFLSEGGKLTGPTFAHAIVTTAELLGELV